ncbi:serine/threonine-protein phosphatase [Sulfurimonas lithotrophica]|uniref:Serine/threonine-protein phosphatase n=1 Tax=Sulfurimonas lithotrophica TaxID=2590022 RepID=A0A5P8NZR7_9BACT|nr:PP2C family serine/threonine-protein phosphatase [Sulfurimonas lithotrophica]QFR48942.1 serine/threonine-protein phosphatase [Sulfurimonas lithotrophica]
MKNKSFSFTHPGHKRRVNEDSFYVNDEKGLWVVCDGMGGHEEGLFASSLATDSFSALELNSTFNDNVERILQTIHFIKQQLDKKVYTLDINDFVGTTLILLYIKDGKALCISAGDSRCYILRNDKLSLVNKDHTRDVIDAKQETRSVLTNAIFAPGDINIDIKKFTINKNDVFLLCSDGLYSYLNIKEIKHAMNLAFEGRGLNLLKTSVLSQDADDNLTGAMICVL